MGEGTDSCARRRSRIRSASSTRYPGVFVQALGDIRRSFGEPDIELCEAGEGSLTVEVKDLDVYDPTTGAVRSSSVDDIAVWFLDTDYDGDAFIVRHAYFTGADDPDDKLRRALRADISDDAWATINSTTSRPFPRPAPGRSRSRSSTTTATRS